MAATSQREYLNDWSRDGKYILYELGREGKVDLWYSERKEDGSGWEQHPFLQGPSNERAGVFSPDGRHVAYVSDESGPDEYEIHVQAFPEGGQKTSVSNSDGRQPRWSRDGKELFYVEGTTLMAVPVLTRHPTFSVGSAKTLFEEPGLRQGLFISQYDVSGDGQHFVLAEPVKPQMLPKVRVVQNWFAEFKDRQPD